MSDDNIAQDVIEAARSKMISLYEQYVDSCLALRTHGIESHKRIDELLRNNKQ